MYSLTVDTFPKGDLYMTERKLPENREELDYDSHTVLDDIRDGANKTIFIDREKGVKVPIDRAGDFLSNLFALQSFLQERTSVQKFTSPVEESVPTISHEGSPEHNVFIRRAAQQVKAQNRPQRAA